LAGGGRDKISELGPEQFDVLLENGDLPLKVLALAAFVAVDGEDLIVLFFAG